MQENKRIPVKKTVEISEHEFRVWICQLETLQQVSGSAILLSVVQNMKNSQENQGISP